MKRKVETRRKRIGFSSKKRKILLLFLYFFSCFGKLPNRLEFSSTPETIKLDFKFYNISEYFSSLFFRIQSPKIFGGMTSLPQAVFVLIIL